MSEPHALVRATLADGVLTLTLDRAVKRNALSSALIDALHAGLERTSQWIVPLPRGKSFSVSTFRRARTAGSRGVVRASTVCKMSAGRNRW